MKKTLSFAIAAAMLVVASSAQAADKKLSSIGVLVGDLANPFFVAIGRGATDAAKKINPDVKVTTVSSNYDLNTQVGQIENFIANKTDLILVNAVDPKGIKPALDKARAAGVVVMAVDVGAEGADATVMSDNVQAGRNACEFLVKKLGGKGNVLIVNGPPVTAVTDRVQGCKEVFAKASGIKILSDNQNAKGSRDGGLEVCSNLLTANAKVDGVFAINDPTGIGCELAMKQANRPNIPITAVDGAPDAQVALKDANSTFMASAAQNPYQMAADAVKIGNEIIKGKKPAKNVVLLPVPLVTKDNVGKYAGWVKE